MNSEALMITVMLALKDASKLPTMGPNMVPTPWKDEMIPQLTFWSSLVIFVATKEFQAGKKKV